MSHSSVGDIFNRLATEVMVHFSDLHLYFVGQEFIARQELWVYVQDKAKFKEVKKFCRGLNKR